MGPVCAEGVRGCSAQSRVGREDVAFLASPQSFNTRCSRWAGLSCPCPRRSLLHRGAPASQELRPQREKQGTRVPSPPSPHATPLAVGRAGWQVWGRGGSTAHVRRPGRAAGGAAMQMSNRAGALLKGSRPELRRACARPTRFAQRSYWLLAAFRRPEAEGYLCALISAEWVRGWIRSARVTGPPLFGNGGWVPRPVAPHAARLRSEGWQGPLCRPNRLGQLVCALPATCAGERGPGAAGATLLCRAHAGAGRALVPPERGSAVPGAWGKAAERGLGAARGIRGLGGEYRSLQAPVLLWTCCCWAGVRGLAVPALSGNPDCSSVSTDLVGVSQVRGRTFWWDFWKEGGVGFVKHLKNDKWHVFCPGLCFEKQTRCNLFVISFCIRSRRQVVTR